MRGGECLRGGEHSNGFADEVQSAIQIPLIRKSSAAMMTLRCEAKLATCWPRCDFAMPASCCVTIMAFAINFDDGGQHLAGFCLHGQLRCRGAPQRASPALHQVTLHINRNGTDDLVAGLVFLCTANWGIRNSAGHRRICCVPGHARGMRCMDLPILFFNRACTFLSLSVSAAPCSRVAERLISAPLLC